MKLFAETMGGNVFETVHTINKSCPEIIPGIIDITFTGGHYSTLIYRAEEQHPYFVRPPRDPSAPNSLGIGEPK